MSLTSSPTLPIYVPVDTDFNSGEVQYTIIGGLQGTVNITNNLRGEDVAVFEFDRSYAQQINGVIYINSIPLYINKYIEISINGDTAFRGAVSSITIQPNSYRIEVSGLSYYMKDDLVLYAPDKASWFLLKSHPQYSIGVAVDKEPDCYDGWDISIVAKDLLYKSGVPSGFFDVDDGLKLNRNWFYGDTGKDIGVADSKYLYAPEFSDRAIEFLLNNVFADGGWSVYYDSTVDKYRIGPFDKTDVILLADYANSVNGVDQVVEHSMLIGGIGTSVGQAYSDNLVFAPKFEYYDEGVFNGDGVKWIVNTTDSVASIVGSGIDRYLHITPTSSINIYQDIKLQRAGTYKAIIKIVASDLDENQFYIRFGSQLWSNGTNTSIDDEIEIELTVDSDEYTARLMFDISANTTNSADIKIYYSIVASNIIGSDIYIKNISNVFDVIYVPSYLSNSFKIEVYSDDSFSNLIHTETIETHIDPYFDNSFKIARYYTDCFTDNCNTFRRLSFQNYSTVSVKITANTGFTPIINAIIEHSRNIEIYKEDVSDYAIDPNWSVSEGGDDIRNTVIVVGLPTRTEVETGSDENARYRYVMSKAVNLDSIYNKSYNKFVGKRKILFAALPFITNQSDANRISYSSLKKYSEIDWQFPISVYRKTDISPLDVVRVKILDQVKNGVVRSVSREFVIPSDRTPQYIYRETWNISKPINIEGVVRLYRLHPLVRFLNPIDDIVLYDNNINPYNGCTAKLVFKVNKPGLIRVYVERPNVSNLLGSVPISYLIGSELNGIFASFGEYKAEWDGVWSNGTGFVVPCGYDSSLYNQSDAQCLHPSLDISGIVGQVYPASGYVNIFFDDIDRDPSKIYILTSDTISKHQFDYNTIEFFSSDNRYFYNRTIVLSYYDTDRIVLFLDSPIVEMDVDNDGNTELPDVARIIANRQPYYEAPCLGGGRFGVIAGKIGISEFSCPAYDSDYLGFLAGNAYDIVIEHIPIDSLNVDRYKVSDFVDYVRIEKRTPTAVNISVGGDNIVDNSDDPVLSKKIYNGEEVHIDINSENNEQISIPTISLDVNREVYMPYTVKSGGYLWIYGDRINKTSSQFNLDSSIANEFKESHSLTISVGDIIRSRIGSMWQGVTPSELFNYYNTVNTVNNTSPIGVKSWVPVSQQDHDNGFGIITTQREFVVPIGRRDALLKPYGVIQLPVVDKTGRTCVTASTLDGTYMLFNTLPVTYGVFFTQPGYQKTLNDVILFEDSAGSKYISKATFRSQDGLLGVFTSSRSEIVGWVPEVDSNGSMVIGRVVGWDRVNQDGIVIIRSSGLLSSPEDPFANDSTKWHTQINNGGSVGWAYDSTNKYWYIRIDGDSEIDATIYQDFITPNIEWLHGKMVVPVMGVSLRVQADSSIVSCGNSSNQSISRGINLCDVYRTIWIQSRQLDFPFRGEITIYNWSAGHRIDVNSCMFGRYSRYFDTPDIFPFDEGRKESYIGGTTCATTFIWDNNTPKTIRSLVRIFQQARSSEDNTPYKLILDNMFLWFVIWEV